MNKKFLIFGANGLVSYRLKELFDQKQLEVISLSSSQVNFENLNQITEALNTYKPSHIINAAAYTAVDKAETEKDLCMKLNATAVGVIGEWAHKNKSHVVHFSTDYVFNGQNEKGYSEVDSTDPINWYGHTKLCGEQYLKQSTDLASIYRVCWIYDNRGKNFNLTMKKLMAEKAHLKIVNDQIGTPTPAPWIAQFIFDHRLNDITGTYHLTPDGSTSWFEFAQEIKTKNNFTTTLEGISTSEYPTPAKRPHYSVMKNEKIKSLLTPSEKEHFKNWNLLFLNS